VVVDDAPVMHEAGLLALDARKAELALGWHDRLDFEATMAWTVAWARRAHDGEDARTLCTEQIGAFLAADGGEAGR